MTTEDPECPTCGGATERGFFPVASIWTKALGDYGDKRSENYYQQKQAGGHVALETDKDSGAVRKVWLDTPQAQASYCKRNGLIDPKNLPSNLSVAADGKSYETVNRSEI